MGKQLTPELIVQRTKTDKFMTIKNLNLWGNDLDEVSAVKDLPNLEVLSLSVNRIATLRDFANCPKLTELYLRKNAIADLTEVQYLTSLKQLRVLWLWDNPCAETPNYRLIVIKMLPQLAKLDNTEITSEERETASHVSIEEGFGAPSEEHAPPPMPVKEIPKKKPEPSPSPPPVQQQAPSVDLLPERPLNTAAVRDAIGSRGQHQPKKAAPAPAPVPAPVKADSEYQQEPRNENILCAVLALLKELDTKSLELVKRDIDRKIISKKS